MDLSAGPSKDVTTTSERIHQSSSNNSLSKVPRRESGGRQPRQEGTSTGSRVPSTGPSQGKR
eukprot:2222389-Heterocapsa_arctica.AAC.1